MFWKRPAEVQIFPVNIARATVQAGVSGDRAQQRIPAMLDHEPKGGGKPISIFESGAMLLYLAEKTGKFFPRHLRRYERFNGRSGRWAGSSDGRAEPSLQQLRPGKNQIRHRPYVNETNRLYGVLNKRLKDREFIAAHYSIADMASYPGWWGQEQARTSTTFRISSAGSRHPRAAGHGARLRNGQRDNPNFGQPAIRTEEERKLLFGQTAAV